MYHLCLFENCEYFNSALVPSNFLFLWSSYKYSYFLHLSINKFPATVMTLLFFWKNKVSIYSETVLMTIHVNSAENMRNNWEISYLAVLFSRKVLMMHKYLCHLSWNHSISSYSAFEEGFPRVQWELVSFTWIKLEVDSAKLTIFSNIKTGFCFKHMLFSR